MKNIVMLSQQELETLQNSAKLVSIPTTGKGITKRARKEKWESEVVAGKGGRGGMKTVYALPDYVLQEIDDRNLNYLLDTYKHDDYAQNTTTDIPEQRVKGSSNNSRTELYQTWLRTVDISDFIAIQYFSDVKASAGHGFINSGNGIPEAMMFRRSFIVNILRVNPADLICIRVHGDSMSPTIKENGTALIEIGVEYKREGIYLIRQGGELKIKRLQKITSEVFRIISDNKDVYPPLDLNMAEVPENEFAILGRYLWDAGIAK